MAARSASVLIASILSLGAAGAASAAEDGACLVPWELVNHQPASATYDLPVRSSSYRDLPAVVMLLSSG
jgi:hypothetical protein